MLSYLYTNDYADYHTGSTDQGNHNQGKADQDNTENRLSNFNFDSRLISGVHVYGLAN